MSAVVRDLRPEETRLAEAFLRDRGADWAPGRTTVAMTAGRIAGLARALDPNPGDGYHREHVREIVAEADSPAMEELVASCVSALGAGLRVEAGALEGETAWIAALQSAGLRREVVLPRAWDGRDRVLLGRAAGPSAAAPDRPARPAAPAGPPIEIAWSAEAGLPCLARFLRKLVPGRAYPPGTLLSEAERLETERSGVERATWLLALRDGEACGGLLLQQERAPQRRGVRRVHLDVLHEHRGQGIGAALVTAAIARGSSAGASRLEADPRSGNVRVLRALRAGGMRPAGSQRGAWRLRGPSGAWDEDVEWLVAETR